MSPESVDLFVPHQANARILDGIAKKLGVTEEDVISMNRRLGGDASLEAFVDVRYVGQGHEVSVPLTTVAKPQGERTLAPSCCRAPKAGLHFGYPYCHQGDLPDGLEERIAATHLQALAEIEDELARLLPAAVDITIDLVWDPPWDPSKMSDEARLELGML